MNSFEIKRTKNKISSIVSGRDGIQKQDFLNFEILTSWDNCREEKNFTTRKELSQKALRCGFEY
eukprot:snap_masked-scaffold_24-processed-gene-3.8-mRNA-1 protein AED:1.00 eAED:1.00 QI:0/0/0/0/1/1/2/0/63